MKQGVAEQHLSELTYAGVDEESGWSTFHVPGVYNPEDGTWLIDQDNPHVTVFKLPVKLSKNLEVELGDRFALVLDTNIQGWIDIFHGNSFYPDHPGGASSGSAD